MQVCFFILALLGLKGGASNIPFPTSFYLNLATDSGSFGSLLPLFHQASVVKIGLVLVECFGRLARRLLYATK